MLDLKQVVLYLKFPVCLIVQRSFKNVIVGSKKRVLNNPKTFLGWN